MVHWIIYFVGFWILASFAVNLFRSWMNGPEREMTREEYDARRQELQEYYDSK